MSGPDRAGEDGADRRRVGLVVASVPVVLFLLSGAFIAFRSSDAGAGVCRHDHPVEQVRSWWRQAREHDVSVPGTGQVTLDEPRDGGPACIRVVLQERRARTHLERRFRRLDVPREVVVYEPAETTDGSAR